MLIHPYANKSLPSEIGSPKTPVRQGDLFDLTIDDLANAASMVDGWLGTVTGVFEYPRGYHTDRLARDFFQKLTKEYVACGGEIPDGSDLTGTLYRI